MMFYIECKVSGGVTGTRTALLKEQGVIREFMTFAEADAVAVALRIKMNGPHATASFDYRAVDDPFAGFGAK